MSVKKYIAAVILGTSLSTHGMQLIAHRGGTMDAPENTVMAIDLALKNKADAVWITLQLSKDSIPVLYRPSDLSALTALRGRISEYTVAELQRASIRYSGPLPQPIGSEDNHIPTLEKVLQRFPHTVFYLDIKSPDARPELMTAAINQVLRANNALNRVRVYSTEDRYIDTQAGYPQFQTRNETRSALVSYVLDHQCFSPPHQDTRWYAFELHRQVTVTENFTLGSASSPAVLSWDRGAVRCLQEAGPSRVIMLGVNSVADYCRAEQLGAEGVVVDSPVMFLHHRKCRAGSGTSGV